MTVRTAPAVTVEVFLKHQLLHPCYIHRGQRVLLIKDREAPMARTMQLQLNKGEYRHKLPRRIFFADQGEFTTGDYEEIMNKASCLSLVFNAILYWNTLKITEIVDKLRAQGEDIDKETLAHISLWPFRHVVPNGMYFIEEV
jgi:hypothetical protein